MKKTAQTLLTAAMFATALGSSAANKTPAENQTAFAAGENAMTTTSVTTTMMPLYGPPWVLSSLEAERQKNATTTEPVTTEVLPYRTTEVLYGPPWVLSSLQAEREKTGTTTTTTTTAPDIPLSGTYNLTLSVRDDISLDYIPDLECELFVIETGKTVVKWNSSDDPEHYIKKLKYEFAERDAFGSITYGLRIKNLPENYTFSYNGGRDYAPVSGDALTDFIENGTELTTSVFLADSTKRTTMAGEFDPYFGTTTTTTETAPVVLYGPPWVFYPTGDVNMDNKTDARDLTLIKQIALGQKQNVDYMEQNIADVDHDYDVDKDDVQIFMKDVLGIPEKEDPAVTTTTADVQKDLETTTRATDVVVLYGPPSMME